MGIPFAQAARIGAYIIGKTLKGEKRYPLVLMLEPLYRCNLACAGCGKIDYPDEILNQRLSYEQCMEAIDECGAPAVSIAGGEPLLHKDLPRIVEGFIARKKFVILCTNALLLAKKIDQYKPSPYFTWSIHLDGDQVMHDKSVCMRTGSRYEKAVEAIKLAKAKGFRTQDQLHPVRRFLTPSRVAKFFDEMTAMGLDGITVSPGYSYERAPDQEHFLNRTRTKTLFREILKRGKGGKAWSFTQSDLFMDFLAGNQTYACSPWSMPARTVFGWQRPCYLLGEEGYVKNLQGADGRHRLGQILASATTPSAPTAWCTAASRARRCIPLGEEPAEGRDVDFLEGGSKPPVRWRRIFPWTTSGRRTSCSPATWRRSWPRSAPRTRGPARAWSRSRTKGEPRCRWTPCIQRA